MNYIEALDILENPPNLIRLCNHSDPEVREAWQLKVIRKAKGEDVQSVLPQNIVAISTGNGSITTIPASESIQLINEINSCPYHIRNSGCPCGKARCTAGKQGEPDSIKNDGSTLVSFFDCGHCLRPDNRLYAENAYKKLS